MTFKISQGVVHTVPADLRQAMVQSVGVTELWNALTPLARNEWICWTVSVKKTVTREKHIERLCIDIKNGKRRPCCFAGCPHR